MNRLEEKELGLELCPPEVGPELRLKDKNQPNGEWYYIAMKPIAGRDGRPYVFGLERSEDGLWLYHRWADPDRRWLPKYEFVFSLRKSEPQKLGLLRRFFSR